MDSIWFAAHSKRHPAGGSFADRYVARYPENSEQIHPFLIISNPLHPLFSKLENLTAQGREALLNGYRAWQQGDVLWLSGEQGWKRGQCSESVIHRSDVETTVVEQL